MNLFKNVLPFVVSSLFCLSLSANAAEVRADVASIVNDSGLNDLQKKSLMQYAESLETILDTNLQDRNAVIATNKEFMLAQTCLAHIYGIDQKPDMMRVSRKIFEKTFEEPSLMTRYHEFLGQAQQEAALALPEDNVKPCKK